MRTVETNRELLLRDGEEKRCYYSISKSTKVICEGKKRKKLHLLLLLLPRLS